MALEGEAEEDSDLYLLPQQLAPGGNEHLPFLTTII